MAAELTFVWDESLQKWVGVGATEARFAKDNTLPAEVMEIEGAKRFSKRGKKYLSIPQSKEKELVKQYPSFKKGKNPITKQVDIVREPIAAGFAAADRFYEENKNKSYVDILGIPREGIAKAVTKKVKETFDSKEEDINAPLPGQKEKEPFVVPTGTPSGVRPLATNVPDVVLQGVVAEPTVATGDGTTAYLGQTESKKYLGSTLSTVKTPDVQTKEYILGKLDVAGPEGDAFRQQVTDAFAKAGIKGDIRKNLAKAIDTTAGANQIKGNQTLWQTIDFMATNNLFTGTGTGPSTKELKNKREAVKLLATELGVNLTQEQINAIGYEYASGNVDATTIRSRIAKQGQIDFKLGEAAKTLEGLKKQAADYGVSYNDSWYTKSAQDILRGVIDNDTLTTQFKENAKSRFPTLVKQIDAGYTVQQIASPYVNSMASILELDPYAINVNDNYIQQALTGLDAEGQPTTKPLWQFERDLRKDPRWSYTKNAQETAMSTTRKILQDFGLAY
jgi:hypothetical protein